MKSNDSGRGLSRHRSTSPCRLGRSQLDPVLQAAATAFVSVHPYRDGNGRLHRRVIHHVLAEREFTPAGMVFPFSSVMLDRIDEYRATLKGHSAPLMGFIEWKSTPDHNIEVPNDTADLYRYCDCTAEAEFLSGCVARTIEYDLPNEIEFLRCQDEAQSRVMGIVDMPDRVAQNLMVASVLEPADYGVPAQVTQAPMDLPTGDVCRSSHRHSGISPTPSVRSTGHRHSRSTKACV